MTLLQQQRAFRAQIVSDDDRAHPASTGLSIYRNAYHARMFDTLAERYVRTRHWIGEEIFAAAAAQYLFCHPPKSWTLDNFGNTFSDFLMEHYVDHPEFSELAWLEWHMQQAFAAPNLPELDPQTLGEAKLDADDFDELKFTMAAGFAAREVSCDCAALWQFTSTNSATRIPPPLAIMSQQLVVWRKAMSPQFRMIDQNEAEVLLMIAQGFPLKNVVSAANLTDPETCSAQLGLWLAGWLQDGVFSEFVI